jgi:site-specific DNA-methyltransferase (adenine-specific)
MIQFQNIKNGTFYLGNCIEVMQSFSDNLIDLTITSPPYDNTRLYKGYSFEFETTAKEIFRITKVGGTLVWIVNDEKINGSESGTSFRQALYFMQCGFKLNDTMIWHKGTFSAVGALKNQYAPVFEYMFVFVKGKQKTFNPLMDRPNKSFGRKNHGTIRQKDGTTKPMSTIGNEIAEYGQRFNVWEITPQKINNGTSHPAVFPVQIAYDHILSWSNENDLVFDPFGGSGTTALACEYADRKWITSEISQEYADEAIVRILKG